MDPKPLHVFEIAYSASRDLPLGSASYGRPPAQKRNRIAHFVDKARSELRKLNLARRRPVIPTAKERNNFGERVPMRADQFDNSPAGRSGVEKMLYGPYDVLKQDDLELPGIGHYRKSRESGQASHERAGPIGREADHHGRPQNNPIEVSLHKSLIAGQFGFRKSAGGLPVDADRRKMDDAPNLKLLAGGKEVRNAVVVNH